ncbi:VQ motif-containing protein 31 [Hibiscus syriacus]|uniref:VQ motif-containing protein 31 n=1 Tax=Hibiscus syriacus TaxID=106335 RepID=A0A6A2ZVR1_HIBSY|nr:VQ motif-containing protein 31-like [Hibiscus syriacus]KAE8694965.1 VQ motif-containing protein 31 [Hibiscus syriacus]
MEKPGSQTAATCKPLTAFVQTDSNTFQEIVQRLTGRLESDPAQAAATMGSGLKRPIPKLHERRQNTMRPKLEIVKPPLSFKPCTSPRRSGSSSVRTSPVGTPSSIFSKLTLQLVDEELEELVKCELNTEEEERAIKERRFYLLPSPRSRAAKMDPQLLVLFPLTSPTTNDKA